MSECYENLLVQRLALLAELNDPIAPELYQTYDVKRGLRYNDGRGVLVGLTQIGDVVGYEIKDDKKIAIPGKLLYRGYDVEELIRDTDSHDEFGFEKEQIYVIEVDMSDEINKWAEILLLIITNQMVFRQKLLNTIRSL